MAEKIYVKGFRGFKPNDKAPDFVLGSLIITPKEFGEFLKSDDVKQYFTEYKEMKQIKINVLRSKDGGLSFEVDTYKKATEKKDDEFTL